MTSTNATINVMRVNDRESYISQAYPIRVLPQRFEGRVQSLDVKLVPLDCLVYRMTNMRTDVRQIAYVRDHHVPEAFFSNGQEDPQAQRMQHGFLVELAKDRNKNIYARLAETHAQEEAFIVTPTGVVVNGNRRLAAMRELLAEHPTEFQSFIHAEVAVLPPAAEPELTELETDLQVAEDLRQPYGWVEEALGLRRCREVLGWDWDRAAAHWREAEPTLKAKLGRLSLSEQYLDHRGQHLHYELLADDRQAFITLQERLAAQEANGASQSQVEAEKLVMWSVLQNKADPAVEGATHDYATRIEDITRRVIASSVVQAAVPAGPQAAGTPVAVADDPLGQLPPAATETVPLCVLEVLRDPNQARAVAVAADQARDDIQEEARQARRGTALSANAQKINATAASLSLTNADQATMQIAASQLVASLPKIAETVQAIVSDRPDLADTLDYGQLRSASQTLGNLVAEREA